MQQFQVRKDDLSNSRLVQGALPELAEGEILTKVDRFALTAKSSRHDGLLHRASHRTGHADHASGSLDWSIKMPAQAGQIPAGC